MLETKQNRLKRSWRAECADHVIALAWRPDGQQLAAAASTGPITLFDRAGTLLSTLSGHLGGTFQLVWSQHLISSGQDGVVRWWNETATIHEVKAGAPWVEHLALSRDGMVASAAGKILRFWNDGMSLGQLPKFSQSVSGIAWRPGTRTLAVAHYGGVSLWEIGAAEPSQRFEWKGSPLALAWSPNGQVLAHGNQDATVHFWTIATGRPLQMSGFPTKVRELAWDPTGKTLATGGGDRACLWDCTGTGPEGTKPQLLEGHRGPLTGLAYQHRGPLLASIAIDGATLLWQPLNRKGPMVGTDLHSSEATTLAWSPDDKRLAVGYADATVAVFSVV